MPGKFISSMAPQLDQMSLKVVLLHVPVIDLRLDMWDRFRNDMGREFGQSVRLLNEVFARQDLRFMIVVATYLPARR